MEDKKSMDVSKIEKLPFPVYFIESSDDDTVLVGIDVTLERGKFDDVDIVWVSWFDTVRDRIMKASEIRMDDEAFSFKRLDRDGGGTYYFRPMNLQIYNEKVKSHLMTKNEFDSDDDLIKAFLGAKENEF